MKTLKFIIVVSIALLSTDLIYHQIVNGQSASHDEINNLLDQINQLGEQEQLFNSMLNYCYQHADRPNPLQDLIDKGFLSSNFTGQTCLSVRQDYNTIVNELAIQQAKLDKINEEKQDRYAKYVYCTNVNKTFEDCKYLRDALNK
jgi:hypothetical protein